MIFNSLDFAVLLTVVIALHLAIRSHAARNGILLVASYVFYGWWDYRFIPLLAASTLVDYVLALRLTATRDPVGRRWLVAASCIANLGLLGFFKYAGLFSSTASGIAHVLGLGDVLPRLHVALPIGISFYTFQSMAYTIDVYRGHVPACRSLGRFALYISFFPQLVAGPIERPGSLIPSLAGPRSTTWSGVEEGVFLFAKGWLLKSIADALGGYCDGIYSAPASRNPWDLLWAPYAFAFQIYCDFFGYSQMARGLALFFGIRLMENFNAPYLASSLRELWSRWHISLTTWLRDYLFIPLGGTRRGAARTNLNLIGTLALAGLWHGADWSFVLWGGLHGMLLALTRTLGRPGDRARVRRLHAPRLRAAWTIGGVLLTFNVWVAVGVLFRAESGAGRSAVGNAFVHLARLGELTGTPFRPPPLEMALVALVLAFDAAQLRARTSYWCGGWPAAARGLTIGLLLLLAMVLGTETPQPFIYFQF